MMRVYIYICIYTHMYVHECDSWVWIKPVVLPCLTMVRNIILKILSKGHYHALPPCRRISTRCCPRPRASGSFAHQRCWNGSGPLGRKRTSRDIWYHFTGKKAESLLWLSKQSFTDAKCIRVCISDAKCCLNHGFTKNIGIMDSQKQGVVWERTQIFWPMMPLMVWSSGSRTS